MIDTLLKSMQTTLNAIIARQKESEFCNRKKNSAIQILAKSRHNAHMILDEIKKIIGLPSLSGDEKVNKINAVLDEGFNDTEDENTKMQKLKVETAKTAKNTDYYNLLEMLSIPLQNKVADIVNMLSLTLWI